MKAIVIAALVPALLIWISGSPRTANGWRWFILVAGLAVTGLWWIDIKTGLGWWIISGLGAILIILAAVGFFIRAINAEDRGRSTRWGDQ